jgi:hypothetical protein
MPVRRPRSAASGSRSAICAEAMEIRIMPAVTATLSSGLLTLQGDQAANDVRIEKVGSSLVVTGENGTVIRYRGETVSTVSLSGVQNLRGNFGAGADVVQLQDGVTLNSVTLNLGDGANKVEFGGANVSGKVAVTGGMNADQVKFDGATIGQLSLNLLNGNDDVEFRGTAVNGVVSINTGDDIDTVKTLKGPGGDASKFLGAVTIKTGSQADVIDLRDSIFANLTIDAGSENDTINLETVTVNGRLSVNGNAGDDDMTFHGLIQTGAGTNSIVGLAGKDDVEINGAIFASAVSVDLGAGPQNVLEIDDVEFRKAVTIVAAGPNDRLRIEQNQASIAATKFLGVVNVQMGPGGVINLGVDDEASYTESHGLVTVKGAQPNVLINLVQTRVEFTKLPLLKNAEFVLVPII